MELRPTGIEGVFEVHHRVLCDERGRFRRLYCERVFGDAGLMTRPVQVNHSVTLGRGSIRGMHYQADPAAEDKLVTCIYGSAFDVAVDLRPGSPTYLRWTAAELGADVALYIPKGCAHGFQALSDECHLVYLHSEFYTPHAESGVRFDDPALAIAWPLAPINLSERDLSFPILATQFES